MLVFHSSNIFAVLFCTTHSNNHIVLEDVIRPDTVYTDILFLPPRERTVHSFFHSLRSITTGS